MKTLQDFTVLYDNECPACNLYTKAFVQSGMLDTNGRQPFTEALACNIPNVDWERARTEIAVVNKKDGSVQYGVTGLVTIISHNAKWIAFVFQFKLIQILLKHLYFFISFNRKVIAPGKTFEGLSYCAPRMNYTYRWAYIIFSWLLTSAILVNYSSLLIPLLPATNFFREFIICGGQIIFQGLVLLLVQKERAIHYLGNMMTISLIGALLLTPMMLFHYQVNSKAVFIGYFFTVVLLMFLEHRRRVKILDLPWYVSATWILYRLIVLAIII